VTLTEEEHRTLESFVHRGKANARNITRARILLKSTDGWSTSELAAAFDVREATVTNVRGRFTRGGVEAVLHDKVQQHRRSVLSGLQTAYLIAVACSPSPDGHDHWTVRLLAQKAVAWTFTKKIQRQDREVVRILPRVGPALTPRATTTAFRPRARPRS